MEELFLIALPLPGQQPVFQQQQRPFGPPSSSPQLTPHPRAVSVSPHTSLPPQAPQGPPHPLPLQPPHLLLTTQTEPPHMGTSTQSQTQGTFAQTQVQNQNKQRPLLLEEQPLLLQDLLDQERQEQQQQKQMQALIRQRSTTDSAFLGVGKSRILKLPLKHHWTVFLMKPLLNSCSCFVLQTLIPLQTPS